MNFIEIIEYLVFYINNERIRKILLMRFQYLSYFIVYGVRTRCKRVLAMCDQARWKCRGTTNHTVQIITSTLFQQHKKEFLSQGHISSKDFILTKYFSYAKVTESVSQKHQSNSLGFN